MPRECSEIRHLRKRATCGDTNFWGKFGFLPRSVEIVEESKPDIIDKFWLSGKGCRKVLEQEF